MWEANAKNSVPVGAKVTIDCDRQEYFLGENVLLHFILENTSDKPFEADFGGDYRGATRPLRFKVTATDESGRMAEDPNPSGFCGGGFGGARKLNPGEKFIQSLPLMRYRRILQPGRYTIHVTHDYGWKEGERKRPVGEISLAFRMPTPDEAEAVVAAMENLPLNPNNSCGERAQNYADFTALCQPIYLKPLLRRAEKGDLNALEGICWIASSDATKALIELVTNANPKLALEAAKTLSIRLPDPALDSTNGFGGFPPFTREARRQLVQNSWDAKLAPAVRSLATNHLAHSETAEVAAGAFMIQAVGTTNEAPAVRAALDRVLDPLVRPRRDPNDNILDQPEGVRELLNAMNILHSRGYTIDEDHLSGQGAFLLYFTWLANQPPPRPGRWLELLNVFGENCRYPTRVAALNSIAEPVPDDCIAFVKARLADDDLGVVRAACTVAGKSGNKDLLRPLLEIIATEHHEWLLREGTDAAKRLGAGFDLLDVWADRLAEEHICHLALENLDTIVERKRDSWLDQTGLTATRGDRIALRHQWKAFLAKHADEIRQGKKFKVDDPALTPALIGRARMSEAPK
jgi:phage tail protein X